MNENYLKSSPNRNISLRKNVLAEPYEFLWQTSRVYLSIFRSFSSRRTRPCSGAWSYCAYSSPSQSSSFSFAIAALDATSTNMSKYICLYHRHLDKQTACWLSLHRQFTSPTVHHQKWCQLPTHKHQADWAEKLYRPGQILPLLPVFLL